MALLLASGGSETAQMCADVRRSDVRGTKAVFRPRRIGLNAIEPECGGGGGGGGGNPPGKSGKRAMKTFPSHT